MSRMNPLLGRLADNTRGDSVSVSLRKQRFTICRRLISQFSPPVSVLDVGGTESFWKILGPTDYESLQVTILNTYLEETSLKNFNSVEGDARDLSRYSSQQFDLVFSNSVIEHVGAIDDQQRMANEIIRVGKTHFVQTPNKYFPVEPHFLVPFFQFMPLGMQVYLLQHYNLGWYNQIPDRDEALSHVLSHRLLTKGELRRLFPKSTIYSEKFFGLSKSFIAYR